EAEAGGREADDRGRGDVDRAPDLGAGGDVVGWIADEPGEPGPDVLRRPRYADEHRQERERERQEVAPMQPPALPGREPQDHLGVDSSASHYRRVSAKAAPRAATPAVSHAT